MQNPFLLIFDGTLDHLLPAGLTTAVTGWLGLVLLMLSATAAVSVDVLRQGRAAAGGGSDRPSRVPGARLRGALFTLALVAAALAAAATLVRFSVLT